MCVGAGGFLHFILHIYIAAKLQMNIDGRPLAQDITRRQRSSAATFLGSRSASGTSARTSPRQASNRAAGNTKSATFLWLPRRGYDLNLLPTHLVMMKGIYCMFPSPKIRNGVFHRCGLLSYSVAESTSLMTQPTG